VARIIRFGGVARGGGSSRLLVGPTIASIRRNSRLYLDMPVRSLMCWAGLHLWHSIKRTRVLRSVLHNEVCLRCAKERVYYRHHHLKLEN
jgi:hypothetical protein